MQTMLLAPPECHQHITGPVPVVRGGREPPPENVDRLNVLTDPGRILHTTCLCYTCSASRTPYCNLCHSWQSSNTHVYRALECAVPNAVYMQLDHIEGFALSSPVEGFEKVQAGASRLLCAADVGILHSAEFRGLQWITSSQLATMSDVLRVHEWAYVSLLQKASAACPDACFAALDSDTIISKGSFSGALAAAGAVISAVDVVLQKEASSLLLQTFCLVIACIAHIAPMLFLRMCQSYSVTAQEAGQDWKMQQG